MSWRPATAKKNPAHNVTSLLELHPSPNFQEVDAVLKISNAIAVVQLFLVFIVVL